LFVDHQFFAGGASTSVSARASIYAILLEPNRTLPP